ncbi:hypothetical protein S4A8_11616 [Salinisphaera sp. S4-8]
MYKQNELDIIPEFQRLFRWSATKKTAFVESILIGIPLPPAFAYEKEDGTWELIDGLQRISTILQFMGMLRDPDNPDRIQPPERLTQATYLPSLAGVYWDASNADEDAKSLEKPLQLFFRRARLDFQILKYPSDAKTKFDLFQRLNRGGEYANEQEVRTCSMVLANSEATRRIRNLANSDAFKRVLRISEDDVAKQKDVEYAVRSLVHATEDLRPGVNVQDFLDRSILGILDSHDPYSKIEDIAWTVQLLDRVIGNEALIPPPNAHEDIANRFSLRALEGILAGIARNRQAIEQLPNADDFIDERVRNFWQQEDVANLSGSGLRGTTRIQRSVPFGSAWFRP